MVVAVLHVALDALDMLTAAAVFIGLFFHLFRSFQPYGASAS